LRGTWQAIDCREMALDKASLERLIEASPDIVVATDADGNVQYYNDGARENLGYTREEIIGRYVVELYPSLEEARRVMQAMRGTEHGPKGRAVNLPTRFVAKDGEEIPVAISGLILYDDLGEEQGTIGFAKDMREVQRKDQLAVLGEVAIGLSHEINNPLTTIANHVSLLREYLARTSGDSAECGRLDTIRREIGRIQEHLDRLHKIAQQQEYVSTSYLGASRMIDLSPSDAESTSLSGSEILVVDDDPEVRASVVEILAADGADVSSAENGKIALELIRSRAFDVVLSDVVMPEMDGYELLMEVRRVRPDMPVVLMTAFYYDKDHVIKRSRMQGLEGILFKKPLDADKLRVALAEQVAGKQR
jgi:PAS domain S-box-containing protein